MVHDPVMAKDGDTYYIFSTGMGISQMTSKDRKTCTVLPQPVMTVIPGWTTDSVPGFGNHVWALGHRSAQQSHPACKDMEGRGMHSDLARQA